MNARDKERLFRAVLVLVTAAVILLLLEATAYRIMVVQQYNFYLPLELNAEHIAKVQDKFAATFDADLGWEPTPTNPDGYIGPPRDTARAAIALFGDSFTQGHPEFEKSWAQLVEKELGRPVLNFGARGYAPDQAYLRFEKRYAGRIHTQYVCLGVMSENVARIVNRYRGFYARKAYLNGVKPRFDLDANGALTLLPTPLRAPEELPRLLDPGFRTEIGATDYWYQYYEREGLNRSVHRPYAYFLLRALPFYVRTAYQKRLSNESDYKHLYRDEHTLDLMQAIVLRFVQRGREEGSLPIVLFFPNWKDLVDYQQRGTTVYDAFFRRVQRLHPATRDAMRYFAPYLDRGDPVERFFKSYHDGHYNERGEQIVSAGFLEDLLEIDREHRRLEP